MGLVRAYEDCFQARGLHTAQVLLTRDDLANRARYLNARSTLRTLLRLGVIPVINENDTVATDELRFGDNDTLAALVANLIEADLLILLTDQDGLFDQDPRTNPGRPPDRGDLGRRSAAGPGRRRQRHRARHGRHGDQGPGRPAGRALRHADHHCPRSGRRGVDPDRAWRAGRNPADSLSGATGGAQAVARRSSCRCGDG